MANQIFEVDIKGLRQLQEGKPKWFIIRELLQNAMDEPVKEIKLGLSHEGSSRKAVITVEDDSPVGFRNLSDIYTLFGNTYKRADVTKRGRFNFGEKQVLSVCEYARIESTTGGYEFHIDSGVKKRINKKREIGSKVTLIVRMSKAEFGECSKMSELICAPTGVKIHIKINEEPVITSWQRPPHKILTCKLQTEAANEDGIMRRFNRDTTVILYTEDKSYLYEMGIPVCEIECDYSIDVQQRVPLSTDRDTVPESYMKTLYGEVINVVSNEITQKNASSQWVRQATESERSGKEAVKAVITQRFGDKALIANPFDRRSMDEAISNNYNVIYGSEMSKDEWDKVKSLSLMASTSEVFKTGIAEGTFIKRGDLTPAQYACGEMAKKIAEKILNITITVSYYFSPGATVIADFGANHLRFNTAHIDVDMWQPAVGYINTWMLDLIIHELGHSAGMHYESSYHECITQLGARLTTKAIHDKDFFLLFEK